MAGANNPLDIRLDLVFDQEKLDRFKAKLGDLKPFFADVGETLLNSTRNRFRTLTAPDGTPWAPLSPAYAARKPRHKNKPLTLSGVLRGTLVKQATADSLRIGTPLIYGATHQFGRGNIPARPFLGMSEADRNDLIDALDEYLNAD